MQNEMQKGRGHLHQRDSCRKTVLLLREAAFGPAHLRRALCCCVSLSPPSLEQQPEWQLRSAFPSSSSSSSSHSFHDRKRASPPPPHHTLTGREDVNRKADRRHVWLFFFFFFSILLAGLR